MQNDVDALLKTIRQAGLPYRVFEQAAPPAPPAPAPEAVAEPDAEPRPHVLSLIWSRAAAAPAPAPAPAGTLLADIFAAMAPERMRSIA